MSKLIETFEQLRAARFVQRAGHRLPITAAGIYFVAARMEERVGLWLIKDYAESWEQGVQHLLWRVPKDIIYVDADEFGAHDHDVGWQEVDSPSVEILIRMQEACRFRRRMEGEFSFLAGGD